MNAASSFDPRERVVALCRELYELGWASGTGGGMSLRQGGRIYVAPSGVQKERIAPEDVFVLDESGRVLEAPRGDLRPSACTPLFLAAYRLRGAGAVLHSHGMNAMLATLVCHDAFRVTHLEMMKGIEGVSYGDELVVPIVENTPHEHELEGALVRAMESHPRSQAVLVRRHGVYVWGPTPEKAKTHAECYDYLFEAAVRMRSIGVDPTVAPASRGAERSGHASTLAR